MLTMVDPLGHILVSHVEAIRIRVDREIAKAEPDPLQFDRALQDQLRTAMNSTKPPVESSISDPAAGAGGNRSYSGSLPAGSKFGPIYSELRAATDLLSTATDALAKAVKTAASSTTTVPNDPLRRLHGRKPACPGKADHYHHHHFGKVSFSESGPRPRRASRPKSA